MIVFKNHCMLIGKYVFVIFLSPLIIRSFRGMGFGSGGQGRTKILKFDIFPLVFAKKVVFLVSSGENVIFATFGRPCKNIFGPLLENPLLAPSWK